MKQVKCPSCASWYEVNAQHSPLTYVCGACNAPYKVLTQEDKERQEAMTNPVSKPPFTWKRWGDLHWSLVILNNIAFIIQTIVFAIATVIGIIVAPL